MTSTFVQHAGRSFMLAALLAAALGAAPVAAGSRAVDLDLLVPPPPPGAICMAVGDDTVRCDTFKDFVLVREPVFEVPCGTVRETSSDHRDGIRWYRGGLLVKRHVDEDATGFWSVDPTAIDGPVRLYASWSSTSSWLVPGDDETVRERFQGVGLRVTGPSGAPIVMIAGQDALDGSHLGIVRGLTDDFTPEAWTALVAALCD